MNYARPVLQDQYARNGRVRRCAFVRAELMIRRRRALEQMCIRVLQLFMYSLEFVAHLIWYMSKITYYSVG